MNLHMTLAESDIFLARLQVPLCHLAKNWFGLLA